MVIGDLHPSVSTTANIHAPPSGEHHERDGTARAPMACRRSGLIYAAAAAAAAAAPPSPPMPPTPVATPTDDGSYYGDSGGSTPAPVDDGSYYDNGRIDAGLDAADDQFVLRQWWIDADADARAGARG